MSRVRLYFFLIKGYALLLIPLQRYNSTNFSTENECIELFRLGAEQVQNMHRTREKELAVIFSSKRNLNVWVLFLSYEAIMWRHTIAQQTLI